jgi:hypothetical protein
MVCISTSILAWTIKALKISTDLVANTAAGAVYHLNMEIAHDVIFLALTARLSG